MIGVSGSVTQRVVGSILGRLVSVVAGGIGLFPKARVWVQKDEYDYYTGEAWQSARTHGGIDAARSVPATTARTTMPTH